MKRRRLLFVILLLISLPLFAVVLPLLVPNGLNQFSGEKQLFAQFALQEARSFAGGSLESFIALKWKVVSVREIDQRDPNWVREESCLGIPLNRADETLTPMQKNYLARVRGFTFFGLPYTAIDVYCRGGIRVNPLSP